MSEQRPVCPRCLRTGRRKNHAVVSILVDPLHARVTVDGHPLARKADLAYEVGLLTGEYQIEVSPTGIHPIAAVSKSGPARWYAWRSGWSHRAGSNHPFYVWVMFGSITAALKRSFIMRNSLLLFVMAAAFLAASFGASPVAAELLAPVYPGAVAADKELKAHEKPFERAFYAREPIEELAAFYENAAGPLEAVRPGQLYENVVRHPPKYKASFEPERIGVRIASDAPAPEDSPAMSGLPAEIRKMQPNRCQSEHFERLRIMAQQSGKHSWDDFGAVCDRFDHLDWAYFEITDETDQRGRPVRKDAVMLADQKEKMGLKAPEDMDAEAIAQRMAQLQQQGRHREAAEMGRRLQKQAMQNAGMGSGGEMDDNWDEWVGYLERLDKHAYRSLIRIHIDPSQWPEEALR